jgi:hypothetical protein
VFETCDALISSRLQARPTGSPWQNLYVETPTAATEEEAMKYVMLIYQGTALEQQAALPEEEQKQVYADYQGINQTPGVTPGLPMGLPENATTVRVEGGKTLATDGPFVGTKEAVGGWFIVEADDLDGAIEVAARVPAARFGGAVEIRPLGGVLVATDEPASPRRGRGVPRPDARSVLTSSTWLLVHMGLPHLAGRGTIGSATYEVRRAEPVSRRVLRLLRTAGQPSEMPWRTALPGSNPS